MLNKKGQSVLIDLMMGILIFLLLMAATLSVWTGKATDLERERNLREMRSKTIEAMDFLIRSQGKPKYWETKLPTEIELIGLATNERVITEKKLNKFVELGNDTTAGGYYYLIKEKLLLGNYDFYFRLSEPGGTEITKTGVDPNLLGAVDTFKIRRIVTYRGEEYEGPAIAELWIYKER